MIDAALKFLKEHLDEQLKLRSDSAGAAEDKAVFVNIAADGTLSFKEGAVTVVLINAEEDRTMRPAEPYRVTGLDGAKRRVQPQVPMNLFVLFIARFGEYDQSLTYISRVIRHFQKNRVLTPQNAPALSPEIGQLTMELHTLSMQQQNDMWNMLKAGYQPSVLYRVKMVIFRDDDPVALPTIEQIQRSAS